MSKLVVVNFVSLDGVMQSVLSADEDQDGLLVREAVGAVPRDRFVPQRVWSWDGYAYVPVDRAVDPERWAAEVRGSGRGGRHAGHRRAAVLQPVV